MIKPTKIFVSVLNNSYFTFIVGYPSGLLSLSGYPFKLNFKHPEALSEAEGCSTLLKNCAFFEFFNTLKNFC